jgi:hypothetical protein
VDGSRFDMFARALSTGLDRRQSIRLALGALAGGALALAADDADARATCRVIGAGCTRTSQCCTGICDTSRSTPRRRRYRCACIPRCDGKICGPDGCGGFCGTGPAEGCATGETCRDEGTVCLTDCADFTQSDGPFCAASTDGAAYAGYDRWQLWGDKACDHDADCDDVALCSHPDFACICERALWTPTDGYDPRTTEQGVCLAVRTTSLACWGAYLYCSETIDGSQIVHQGTTSDYDGNDASCLSNDTCIALDDRCLDPGSRCICEIGSYSWPHDLFFRWQSGTCRRIPA